MERVLFIGARRGLGSFVFQSWRALRPQDHYAVTSRKPFLSLPNEVQFLNCDLSQETDVDRLIIFINTWQPHRIFCFAGGGPYGPFAQKNRKDHQWALQVSFLSPMKILWEFLQIESAKQFIAIGSSIAESLPDPNAASYCAAKHALKGLIETIQSEKASHDVRLFSPGYMATDLLPLPQRQGLKQPVHDPEVVAQKFVSWALESNAPWHFLSENI